MIAVVALWGCSGPAPKPPLLVPVACEDVTLDWDNFARGYVQTWCTPCHSESLEGDDRQGAPETVDFDAWSDVVFWSERVKVRATGADADMPPRLGVDPEDLVRLEAWLDCGAPGADDPPAVCDTPVVVLDATVATQADADALCADPAVAVASLTVTGDVVMDCLCAVDADLSVAGGALSAPVLRTVGGDVSVSGAATSVLLPALTAVGGAVSIAGAVQELDLTGLQDVAGPMQVIGTDSLSRLALDDLLTAGGFEVRDSQLAEIEVPRLRSVDGSLILDALSELVVFDGTRALIEVHGDIVLTDLAQLPEVDTWGFQFLETLDGDLTIDNNGALTNISGFTLLSAVGGSVVIEDNPNLVSIDGLDNVRTIAGELRLNRLDRLQHVLGLDNLDIVSGGLVLQLLPELQSLAGMGALTEVASLSILTTGATEIPWLANLTAIHLDLVVVNNADLVSVDLPGVTSLGQGLVVQGNNALASVAGWSSITSVGDDLRISDNAALSTTEIMAWLAGVSVGGTTTIEDNG